MFINIFLTKYNIRSKVINLLITSELTTLKARGHIYECAKEIILNNLLFGKGLFGDREALRIVSGVTTYVHNIFLEIWIDFGLIFGTFFIIAVLFLLIRGLFNRNTNCRNLVCYFIPMGFIKLFVSGSYLQEPFFFILMGICVSTIINKKNIDIVEHEKNYTNR